MELREEVARAMFAKVRGKDGKLKFDEVEPIRDAYMTGADAAIAIVLRKVERHLSAVQYDPAPYTALKHRLAELRQSKPGQENGGQHWSDCAVHNEPYAEAGPCDCGGVGVDMRRTKLLDDLLGLTHKEPNQ